MRRRAERARDGEQRDGRDGHNGDRNATGHTAGPPKAYAPPSRPGFGIGAATGARAPRRAPRGRARRRRRSRPCPTPTRTSRPVIRCRPSLHPCRESRIDRRLRPRLRPRARPARRALRGPHRHPLRDDLARKPPPLAVVGDGEHGPRVALGELAALDHREHVVGELEEPQLVRDRRLRASDPLGDLAEGQLELVQQHRVGARLLDRGEILAGDVLDEADQERVAVVGLADHGRQRGEPGLAGRAPAPLAGDQLVAALEPGPEHDRLHDALVADRVGEPVRRLVVEAPPRLARVRVDLVDRDVRELHRRASDQDLEATAEAAPRARFSCVRQAPSPPSSRPRRRVSAGRSE